MKHFILAFTIGLLAIVTLPLWLPVAILVAIVFSVYSLGDLLWRGL